MNRQVLCLSVFRRNMPSDTNEMQWLYPTPKFAFRIVTESLIKQIEILRNILVEQQLVNVACLDTEISWFESVEQSSRLQVQAVMYVAVDKVWFSGRVEPHSEDYFETQTILLADVFDNKSSIKTIDFNQFNSPLAMPLIREIRKKSTECDSLFRRYDAFEELSDSLSKITNIETDYLNTNLDSMCHEMAQQIDKLKSADEKAEKDLDILGLKLLEVVFGITVGDRIDYLSSNSDNPISLVIRRVSFHDGTLIVSGPKILKSGDVGKRDESIFVPLQQTE
ncbi:hypothetical protein [Paraglaciecola aestuariivivens]